MHTNKMQSAIPFSVLMLPVPPGIVFAQTDQKQASYDPVVMEYVEEIIKESGTSTEARVIDGQTIAVTTKVKQVSQYTYGIETITHVDDEKKFRQSFNITSGTNGTYSMVNTDLGINETFTDQRPLGVFGVDSRDSSLSGARTYFHDREFGTPHTVKLYDGCSACARLDQAEFQATIRPNTLDVTWEASPFYLHLCLLPHSFDYGEIQYNTDVHYLDGHNNRHGSHAFTNSHSGTAWHSIEADFVYGER